MLAIRIFVKYAILCKTTLISKFDFDFDEILNYTFIHLLTLLYFFS